MGDDSGRRHGNLHRRRSASNRSRSSPRLRPQLLEPILNDDSRLNRPDWALGGTYSFSHEGDTNDRD